MTDSEYLTDIRASSSEGVQSRFCAGARGCVNIATQARGLCGGACRDEEEEAEETEVGCTAKRVGSNGEAIALDRSGIDSASRKVA